MAVAILRDSGNQSVYFKFQTSLEGANQMKLIFPILAVAGLLSAGCASVPAMRTGLTTTTPVTQNRDHAIYDWQQRHAEILEYNRTHQPRVVIIGDSIIHYWGGEPAAPKAWARTAWENAFFGVTVENLGFGWDRTENVLWRIQHGELDGIKPKLIIIKIGTNNTGINTDEEIAAGIEAVCALAHRKQPDAKILLLGILPRRDEKPPRPVITDRVNQRLQSRLGKISWLTYCDLGGSFRQADGRVDAALFKDGVHVNPAGYEILAARIHEEIAVLLK
ncbi:MAG: GDSL-type esterase/lipase family protein [Verrucomicrobiota bacterium]